MNYYQLVLKEVFGTLTSVEVARLKSHPDEMLCGNMAMHYYEQGLY